MTGVLILGAGPAGLAAAKAARSRGVAVTLVDSADALGGQYWRHLPAARSGAHEHRLHHGWSTFTALRDALASDPGIRILAETQVWAIDRDPDGALRVHAFEGPVDGQARIAHELRADAIILAIGAHDRTLPFPGWTLPGVFTAGAAQALAKGERVAVGRRVVVSGAGPFLLPVAASLTQVGAQVTSVHEAARIPALTRGWLPRPWRLLGAAHKATELAGYVGGHLRHRIAYRLGEGVIAAHGNGRVESVTVAKLDAGWSPIPGTERTIEADAVCVGHGFLPRVELAIAAGCALTPERFVVVDDGQQTSVTGVFAAGEVTGVGGADAALVEGEIAGLAAAAATVAEPFDIPASLTRRRRTTTHFAQRLEAAHGIRPGWQKWLDDATVVCRCEGVTAGRLRHVAAATEQASLRSVKLTTRAGLGICQGRMCGRTVEQLIGADADGGRADHRPIVTPVRLAELAEATPTPDTERGSPQ
ncbi:NAD(P)/FAD-dependent oxidoreductase [Microbacterium invictum]|uniref:NADPH-dependent 2,4-dienoyl-CoA reductase/sulfur reductase-like enzyme n=1 Tax=Microbacterium invictum TaxID=515415 RepID=A0AA40SPE0_9MICO|nr:MULTISPECIES: NAD(P)/FAD-dependent oxidoreductase [Microbacterium]MBB4139970.1 NADPH-dependent 2,4-dienoyl-CoA reductase/sulfur reductase-like enzyme [Microbacterium invictum]